MFSVEALFGREPLRDERDMRIEMTRSCDFESLPASKNRVLVGVGSTMKCSHFTGPIVHRVPGNKSFIRHLNEAERSSFAYGSYQRNSRPVRNDLTNWPISTRICLLTRRSPYCPLCCSLCAKGYPSLCYHHPRHSLGEN